VNCELPKSVGSYDLSPRQLVPLNRKLAQLTRTYCSAQDPDFLENARQIAFASLPIELLQLLNRFYRKEFVATVVIRGFRVNDDKLGPTPSHWNRHSRRAELKEEMFLTLLGSVLGDLFGWSSLQNGNLVHNVVPIRGQEYEQSGHGSLEPLAWHTEDGFHPFRCDYLGLMALRNHDRIPTTFASLEGIRLTTKQRAALFEPRFLIRPDNEHLNQRRREQNSNRVADDSVAVDWSNPSTSSVLFGDPDKPYLRIDPTFMSAAPEDREAEQSLRRIISQLDAALEELILEPGAVCFIDNYRAIHGRAAFTPKYDGKDRWLKKILLTRDPRRSKSLRHDPARPVLEPTFTVSSRSRIAPPRNALRGSVST
jgi:Fe(II)/alpha-ketoglutarate-dependent arginine beta-hydroxylase